MEKIVEVINNLENLRCLNPATADEIQVAEISLGLKFAQDYIEYVKNFGVISAKGIELTGVTHHPRLSVVNVTEKERELNSKIPSNMYVIENMGIDGFVALQDETGKVYSIAPNAELKLEFNSLSEYVANAEF